MADRPPCNPEATGRKVILDPPRMERVADPVYARLAARFDALAPPVRFVIAILISLLLWGMIIAVVAGADPQSTAQD